MENPIVKVCGMREPENIFQLSKLPIDEIGMIFSKDSHRYVEEMGFASVFLRSVTQKTVGVFVDSSLDFIKKKVQEYRLQKIQLHGSESPEFCEELKNQGLYIVKAIPIKTPKDLDKHLSYLHSVDQFLFDTKGELPGGNGYTFDWAILEGATIKKPYMLSGGIGPEHSKKIRKIKLKNCIGIDLNSRFEFEPGYKNIELIKVFLEELKSN